MKKSVMYVTAALFGIVIAISVACCMMVVRVTDEGMEPAITSGSIVLVNKVANELNTGDIVAFRNNVYGENGEGNILVRRVVAVSGDTVEIKDNMLYLNNRPYTDYMSQAAHMEPYAKRTLGEGEIFVLCDNRMLSMDSRDAAVSILSPDECYGRVCFK